MCEGLDTRDFARDAATDRRLPPRNLPSMVRLWQTVWAALVTPRARVWGALSLVLARFEPARR